MCDCRLKKGNIGMMNRKISIGNQGFDSIREKDCFYIDKTNFIKEWWESQDAVTLIARPRRFGKTLNMNMLNCFFSNKYADRGDLFEGLSIWNEEKYQKLQGTYPVIFLSFADVKQPDYKEAVQKIKSIITDVYNQFTYLKENVHISEGDREQLEKIKPEMDNVTAQDALKYLAGILHRIYGKKAIILLDEYDTPMQEAYVHGYWDEFTSFIRGMFNSTFKTNPYMERAVMTGITRVSKESIFSDLNNLNVVTTTSEEYAECFGFTEKEVFAALEEFGLAGEKEKVKEWYDGFTFGSHRDIYNPWSITSFLDKKQIRPYWASTSSNGLINKLIQTASVDIKSRMEDLLNGKQIVVNFDEQIVFDQLDRNENAIWSLLLASGYLKVDKVEYRGITMEPWYHLSITNLETMSMFSNMFKGWFAESQSNYNGFVKALLSGNLKEMNIYMNEVALTTFSSFDTGKNPSRRTEPERFYHGFVLGLLVELRDLYEVRSNRESGYGRYDVRLIPHDKNQSAIILEFKVFESDEEIDLKDTVNAALKQIEDRHYDSELIALGIKEKQIRHYGFAFEGKKVLIGG